MWHCHLSRLTLRRPTTASRWRRSWNPWAASLFRDQFPVSLNTHMSLSIYYGAPEERCRRGRRIPDIFHTRTPPSQHQRPSRPGSLIRDAFWRMESASIVRRIRLASKIVSSPRQDSHAMSGQPPLPNIPSILETSPLLPVRTWPNWRTDTPIALSVVHSYVLRHLVLLRSLFTTTFYMRVP